ncbi:MAG: polysaccharide deacetylase family protein [Bacteroidetes bacterium]|nr:polysaccharide deacetylase family protein [Bacteroidota bacterium]
MNINDTTLWSRTGFRSLVVPCALLCAATAVLSACGPSPEHIFTYPGGKTKALVLSYDDGPIEDIRLAQLFDQHGLVGTFNLNSGYLGQTRAWPQPDGDSVYQQYLSADSLLTVYARHEIAAHGTYHKNFKEISNAEILEEVKTDAAALERMTGRGVRSLAYPFGSSNAHIAKLVGSQGITSARTVSDTRNVNLPKNLLLWHPTIHDSKCLPYAESYKALQTHELTVLYVWGHAWELKDPVRWKNMQQFCAQIAQQDNIWYVSQGELADYLLRLKNAEITKQGMRNPEGNGNIWIRQGEGARVLEAGEFGNF